MPVAIIFHLKVALPQLTYRSYRSLPIVLAAVELRQEQNDIVPA